MSEEKKDMIPPNKKFPVSLENHLKNIIPENDLEQFHEQLPAAFLSDATEGLHEIQNAKHLESVLQYLNQQMHRQLTGKRKHKKKIAIGSLSLSYWALITILLLVFVAYFVIHLLLHH
jgi:hypothetical protein